MDRAVIEREPIMLNSNPVTVSDIEPLLDTCAPTLAELLELDAGSEPVENLANRATAIILRDTELLRRLAAIGRGVPLEQVKAGSILNTISAMACLHATSTKPWVGELVEAVAARLYPPAAKPGRRLLRLVVANDE